MTPAGLRLPAVTVGVDELDLLTQLARIDELPVVLDARSRFDTTVARDAAFESCRESLTERGLLPGGHPHPDVVDRLTILARPDVELAVRWYREGTVSRMCIAQVGQMTVLALRGPDSYVLAEVPAVEAELVLDVIGRSVALDVDSISAPTDRLVLALDDLTHPQSVVRRLSELGARETETLAWALSTCTAHAEIVALVQGDGRRWTSAPVTVFDTAGGRIVGTSSVSPDGTAWSTLGPGGDARLRQAIGELLTWAAAPHGAASS
ncbi:ESX secretion-associated protein EspG [Rhodococcus gannanensis]|uniref:ESX secretion-associated protein EspG n=1 Tax=Rhodococcus gannanensis TaxID=1960308 RepID=A0ABW4P2F2_9NOCA